MITRSFLCGGKGSSMRLGRKLLLISFKEKSIFRFDYIVSTAFSFLYIVLKVYMWKGLYGTGEKSINGIILNDMIVYTILSGLTEGVTRTSVMGDLNNSVLNGSISSNLLLPVGLKKYLFIQSLSRNIFLTVYKVVPSVLAAMLFFGFHLEIDGFQLILYMISLSMGIVLNFLYSFLLGSSVIWFRNAFFLSNMNNVLQNLFSGALVPIWFFPQGLKRLSDFLPFRYVVFEPIALLLNKKSPEEAGMVLGIQLFWIVILSGAVTLVWNRGRRKIMIQGG